MLLLFAATLFVSAFLLFLVQPMFARMVLPLLGGSPAVWNTAMLFFQGALLAGYAYADASIRRLGVRRQCALHLALLLLPLLVLPIALPQGWRPPVERNPIPWLLALMAVSVGLPFVVVSTSSSVLQRWFAATGHPAARDPYFLYSASNLGSMLALVGYPTLVEPHLRLAEQSRFWTAGYLLLLLLTAGCAVCLLRARASGTASGAALAEAAPAPPLPLRRRLVWALLAFVPSSLMLGVTTYLSTDIAAVPLLWVVPLALYLLTFILAFARRPLAPEALLERALPVLVTPLAIVLAMRASQPLSLLMPLHLATFFVAALLCHGKLAKERPPAAQLTQFYFWLSVGGALGGVFNALVAPALFTGIVEYPAALVLACLLGLRPAEGARRFCAADLLGPLGLGALTLALVLGAQAAHWPPDVAAHALLFGLPGLLCFFLSRRPAAFALGVAVFLSAALLWRGVQGRPLHAERSFFGVHRVTVDPEGRFRQLVHGSTLHGRQAIDPARRREPLTYFTRTGPIGQIFEQYGDRLPQPFAVVGLGVGSLAAYARPGQRWTFYEIDPAVLRIASDSRYFTFLRDCPAKWEVVLGDARLSLAARPERYGLLVLDAYSSDSLPVHLITREALRLYLDRLAEGGLLVFQASNRHLDLEPVLAALAEEAGLTALYRDDTLIAPEEEAAGKTASQWAVMARRPETLAALMRDARWRHARRRPGVRLWTDDYSSLFSVFRWE